MTARRIDTVDFRAIQVLADDPDVQHLNARLNKARWKAVMDKSVIEELRRMAVFNIPGHDPTLPKSVHEIPVTFSSERDLLALGKYFERTQAYRDRALEILMTYKQLKRQLVRLKLSADALLRQYRAYMTLDATVGRKFAFNRTFPRLPRLIDHVDNVVEYAQYVIDNLVNTHFSLREIRTVGSTFLEKVKRY